MNLNASKLTKKFNEIIVNEVIDAVDKMNLFCKRGSASQNGVQKSELGDYKNETVEHGGAYGAAYCRYDPIINRVRWCI